MIARAHRLQCSSIAFTHGQYHRFKDILVEISLELPGESQEEVIASTS